MSFEGGRAGSAAMQRSIAIDLVRVIALTAVVTRHLVRPKGRDRADHRPVGHRRVLRAHRIPVVLAEGPAPGDRRPSHPAAGPVRDLDRTDQHPDFIWAYQESPAWWATRLLLADFYGAQLMVLPFSVSWFFTVMFIAVVLLRFLGRFPREFTWGLLAVTVIITVVVPKVLWYTPLGAGLALVCMLFIVLGQEFRRVRDRVTMPFLTGVAALAAGSIAVWLGAAQSTSGVLIEIKLSTYGYPVAGLLIGVAMSSGVILIAESFERWIPKAAGPCITEAASTATFSMFLHPVILFVLGTPQTGRFPDFLVALLVPYVLAVVCLRRGWLTWLTGAPRPPLPVAESVGRVPVIGRA